ncbi:hypothetical protein K9M48_04785 [Candidatus Gracilibacteria bacterium]|nr:hypothetical protein [Candidatus Gracilibacteria bacterium]
MLKPDTKEFLGEVKSDIKEFGRKFLDKLTGKEKAEKEKYREEFYQDLKSLSYEQKEFFIGVINYAKEDGRDFSITTTVNENRPEDYNKIMKIFGGLSQSFLLDYNKVIEILNKEKYNKPSEDEINYENLKKQNELENLKNKLN